MIIGIRRATLVVAGLRQGAPRHERSTLTQPGWDGALRAVSLVRLLAKGINHCVVPFAHPTSQTTVAAPRIYSAVLSVDRYTGRYNQPGSGMRSDECQAEPAAPGFQPGSPHG